MTDRDGAVRMIARFCDATDYLDLLKKVMTDGGYTGEKFAEVTIQSGQEKGRRKRCPERHLLQRRGH